ncbi:MAG: hypothetical protein K2N22_03025 [Clostridia bacterium]|nr:hypothetical protein [Clostridia bacterium]
MGPEIFIRYLYNDGYDIAMRVKASTLPLGLTLDSLYTGMEESDVDNYTATISASDLKYNTSNFNAPDTSKLNLKWEIAKKNLFASFKNVKDTYTNANGSGSFIIKQLDVPAGFESYIKYEYYDKSSGLPVTLDDIKAAADPTNEKKYIVKAYIDPAYASNYEVDNNGATPSDEFATGSKNKLATATIDGKDGSTPIKVEYDGNTHFDSSLVKITSDTDGLDISDFTVKYYKGKTATAANELPAGELPKDAGEYCVEIILGTQAAKKYILAKETLTVTVEAKGIDLPVLGTITFNGNEQNFVDNLSGDSWTTYGPSGLDIIKVDGKLSDRNVSAGSYSTTLELLDTNYKWIYPSSISPTKAIAKYSLAAGEVKVTGDDVTATYNWNITPLIVDTTNMWSKGKTGATLNLPQNIRDLIAGGTLEVGYRYYDSEGNYVEEPELKGGRSFKVEAVFAGDDAERNVQFKRSETDFGSVSKSIDYTVPQSGAAAFFGNVKDALSKTWLGLPIWAWLLIALALIILLIVIIVVACKRRKSKEEKEEIKARKAEEKARREEERRMQQERLEEERRMQQEKLEAERELARAKQEAELEKIRAQAQAAAGAGMASMAVQQQPQPQVQPVQQPMPQQVQYVPVQQQPQQPMMMPMPQYQPYPMPQPQYPYPSGSMSDINAIAEAKAAQAIAEAKAAEAHARAAEAVAEAKAAQAVAGISPWQHGGMNYGMQPQMQQPMQMQQQPFVIVLDENGQVKAMQQLAQPQMQPAFQPILITAPSEPKPAQKPVAQIADESASTASVPASYPPDAVITTTTTVDTTKKNEVQSFRRTERDSDNSFVDVDGFYDAIE